MEAQPAVLAEREQLELPADVKPPGASLRWRWSSSANTAVLPSDAVPPWLSPARVAPPPAVAPTPLPAREAAAEVEEYSSWHGARRGFIPLPSGPQATDAFRAALPEELLEAVMRLLDAQLRDWPERGSLLAVRGPRWAPLSRPSTVT